MGRADIAACTWCSRRLATELGRGLGPGQPAVGLFMVKRPITRRVTEDRLCQEHINGLRRAGYTVQPKED